MNAVLGLMIFDQWWWLFIPGLLLGVYAQMRLSSSYKKYINEPVLSGVSGAEAARQILNETGLFNVQVYEVDGHLTDHYDPTTRSLHLSKQNFHGRTIAALGVSAHEAGHALQHQAAYGPLELRMKLVPVMGFASQGAFWISMAGMFIGLTKLALFGVVVFGVITLFQLITLPVEFDASRRAKQILLRTGLVEREESNGVAQVLDAAAWTYVAAMVSSLLTLLHFVLILRGDDRES